MKSRIQEIERVLKISEENFHNIIQNNNNCIMIVDQDNIIQFANFATHRFFDFDKINEAGGKFLIPLNDNNCVEFDYLKVESHTIGTGEIRVSQTNWNDTYAKLFTIQDITKRKENEHSLTMANESLLNLDKLKDNLIATISHELRTPLASVLGYAEALHDCEISKRNLKDFSLIIVNEAHRLSRLIESLLDFSLIKSGHLKLNIQEVCLKKIIEISKKSVLGILNERKKIKILNLNNPNITLHIDQDKIVQVIVNLLSNAIKFTPDNEDIIINVTIAAKEVVVSVSDKGPGIPEGKFDKIFDEFYKIDKSKNFSNGTGLGLSIAKGIIDAHNGRIWADNQVEGTVFSISLPLYN